MLKPKQKVHAAYLFADLALIAVSFYVPYLLKYRNHLFHLISGQVNLPNLQEYSFTCAIWVVFLVTAFKRRRLYMTDRDVTIPRETWRVFLSVVYTAVLVSALIFFAQYKFFSREIFVESAILSFLFLAGWRLIKRLTLRRLIKRGYHNINVLIVGTGKAGMAVLEEIKRNPWWGFKVVGFLDGDKGGSINGAPVLGSAADFSALVRKYFVDEVMLTIPLQSEAAAHIVRQARQMSLGLRVVPFDLEAPLQVISVSHLGALPILTYKERFRHPSELALKRFIDFFAALVILALLAPLFIVIAVLIKLDCRGPVFFVQKRAGLKGRKFRFYKFRSMVSGAESLKAGLMHKNEVKDGVIFKIKDDPRVTRVGRFLRKYSLDELPQLFNVLRGDMSLVGPRPPTPDEVEKYNHIHMQRLSIRPGITGLSQVRGRSQLTFHRWVRWDLWYVNNWSLGLDLRILFLTIPVAIKGRGAY